MKSTKNLEEAILNILLNNQEMIFKAHLEPRWFVEYRKIAEILIKLSASGMTIDVFSVADAMGGRDSLSIVVGLQKEAFGAKSNFIGYVSDLKKMFEEREIKELIKKSYHSIGIENSGSEILSKLIAESIAISSTDGNSKNYNVKQALGVFINKLDEIYEARDTGGVGLKTGIKSLDEEMGGMHPSDMAIVGARPGMGKTAFAVSVMRNVLKQGKRVAFFSTEMSVFQVMSRFASIEANIDAHKLRQANLDEQDFARITAAIGQILGFDLRVCDKPAITIGELSMQARAWAADGGLDFIAVDYLTRLHPDKAGSNQNLDVGLIVAGLKNIARNLNIPIMVLAQLNRSASQRKDKRPVMSDLRDSGIIEQEADQILMLYRPDDDGAELDDIKDPQVIIEKNRHGSTGIVRCEFEPSTMHWRDKEFTYAR
jgi:replicative DNA helicase